MKKQQADYLPKGARFTTDSGYKFGVISAADMENAAQVARCAHGESTVQDCQRCWTVAVFHRQILRMAEWMQRQYGTDWGPDATRNMADEKTREHAGFLPDIGPAPSEKDLAPLPPIKLSAFGLVVRPHAIEGNRGDVAAFRIGRSDGLEPNDAQRALLDAISDGAQWVA